MLCGYQLASLFTEDARICAALGSYWPGVAPDSTRTFEPRNVSATVIPLTDNEIGLLDQPAWDGRSGPSLIELEGRTLVQYQAYEYGDYTQAALDGRISLAATGQTSTKQYHQRVLGMRRAYQAVGAGSDTEQRKRWPLLSFFRCNYRTKLSKSHSKRPVCDWKARWRTTGFTNTARSAPQRTTSNFVMWK